MDRPIVGMSIQSTMTGFIYEVMETLDEDFKIQHFDVKIWRPIKSWDEHFVILSTPGDDKRVESLFYSAKLDTFQIVGVDEKGKFYRASSLGQWTVDNQTEAAQNLNMNDYKLVGRL